MQPTVTQPATLPEQPPAASPVRIAIAHEWVAMRAGSEKTFEALAQAFPDAHLYALTAEPSVALDVGQRRIRTTFLDRPALRSRRELTLPAMPAAWRYAGVGQRYDVAITSSHACAKGFRPGRDALHLSYCHTPMRYAWDPQLDARAGAGVLRRSALDVLRRWDVRSAGWVDGFAANSTAVRDRIRQHYDRDAVVIHPPVDVDFFTPAEHGRRSGYALAVSRFIPYKRLDVVIDACARLAMPVVLAGSGPEESRLRSLAERHPEGFVRFELNPSDDRLRSLYRGADVLVFPAHEDFGIIPVEAQACGTPVVALDAGGTRDTVVDGTTGVLVPSQDVADVAVGIETASRLGLSAAACRRNAERFSTQRFRRQVRDWVQIHSTTASSA